MLLLKRVIQLVLIVILMPASALYADEHKVGDVSVQYSVLNTSFLSAEVAAQYGLTRSKKTGLVNISVKKNGRGITANVFGHAKNMAGQIKELAFKEVKESSAVYYLATFSINNAEKLKFDLQVQPEKQGILVPLGFSKQLFVD